MVLNMISKIFNHSSYLEKSLDASWLRNEVIANNISNVDTPNFKSSSVEFESILEDKLKGKGIEMKKTKTGHISQEEMELKPRVVLNEDTTVRMDGNNVDIENEQINLAKNTIYYNTLVQKIGEEFNRIKYVISEGK